ncbi:uncharacterized protein B0I36DRAFT_29989 [Microdochium trichocladiopsis]|uniref:Uncharacterized protein n=1 Tax=Microdochium trichocladiopsis TaxID=1682393 RepID=A0A9P9BKH3_9PEZI|nr:uncharacterized protein B0I36DRAFT_29989 [Microdochium trichocladiopsis]KAH7021206.1 hypothetical protein B0I36DRAFT_29989 [Microdochium trichocladiopsis]
MSRLGRGGGGRGLSSFPSLPCKSLALSLSPPTMSFLHPSVSSRHVICLRACTHHSAQLSKRSAPAKAPHTCAPARASQTRLTAAAKSAHHASETGLSLSLSINSSVLCAIGYSARHGFVQQPETEYSEAQRQVFRLTRPDGCGGGGGGGKATTHPRAPTQTHPCLNAGDSLCADAVFMPWTRFREEPKGKNKQISKKGKLTAKQIRQVPWQAGRARLGPQNSALLLHATLAS